MKYILDNKNRNLHTLVLLDLDPTGLGVESPEHMSPSEAGRILLKMVEKYEVKDGTKISMGESVTNWPVIVLSDLGTEDSRVCSTSIGELSDLRGGRIHCLILPSSMDDLERMSFDRMYVGD